MAGSEHASWGYRASDEMQAGAGPSQSRTFSGIVVRIKTSDLLMNEEN